MKSNDDQKKDKFDENLVETQLTYLGIADISKIRKFGFPKRIEFESSLRTLGCLYQPKKKEKATPENICHKICAKYLKKDAFAIGKTRIFLKEDAYSNLQHNIHRLKTENALILQTLIRKYYAVTLFKQKQAQEQLERERREQEERLERERKEEEERLEKERKEKIERETKEKEQKEREKFEERRRNMEAEARRKLQLGQLNPKESLNSLASIVEIQLTSQSPELDTQSPELVEIQLTKQSSKLDVQSSKPEIESRQSSKTKTTTPPNLSPNPIRHNQTEEPLLFQSSNSNQKDLIESSETKTNELFQSENGSLYHKTGSHSDKFEDLQNLYPEPSAPPLTPNRLTPRQSSEDLHKLLPKETTIVIQSLVQAFALREKKWVPIGMLL